MNIVCSDCNFSNPYTYFSRSVGYFPYYLLSPISSTYFRYIWWIAISPTSGIVMQLKRELQKGEMQYEKKAGHHVGTKYTMGIVLKNSIMKKELGKWDCHQIIRWKNKRNWKTNYQKRALEKKQCPTLILVYHSVCSPKIHIVLQVLWSQSCLLYFCSSC